MSYFRAKQHSFQIEYEGFQDEIEKKLCEYHLNTFIKAFQNYGVYDIECSFLYESNVIYILKTSICIVWLFAKSEDRQPRVYTNNYTIYTLDDVGHYLRRCISDQNIRVIHRCIFNSCNICEIKDEMIHAAARDYSDILRMVQHRYCPSQPVKPKYNNPLFKKLYEGKKTAFIIMKFSEDERFNKALGIIKRKLADYGIVGIRADERQFANTVWENIKVYMDNADYGIAIAESVEDNYINSNVSVEIGYMLALKKKVCLLKEKSLDRLHSDFAGIIYNEFDINNVKKTIPSALEKWMTFENIIKMNE